MMVRARDKNNLHAGFDYLTVKRWDDYLCSDNNEKGETVKDESEKKTA